MDHASGRVQFPSFLTGIHPTIAMNTLLSFYRQANPRIYWTCHRVNHNGISCDLGDPNHHVRPRIFMNPSLNDKVHRKTAFAKTVEKSQSLESIMQIQQTKAILVHSSTNTQKLMTQAELDS